ncbi:MAG TPA: hypothetical protein VE197_06085, partial [Mycobacterium sp.]|nr:hypothetical protein [Mycobacterium sp.]
KRLDFVLAGSRICGEQKRRISAAIPGEQNSQRAETCSITRRSQLVQLTSAEEVEPCARVPGGAAAPALAAFSG